MGKTILESLLGSDDSQQKKIEKKQLQYKKLKEELAALERELSKDKCEEESVLDTMEEAGQNPKEVVLSEKEELLLQKEKELEEREKNLQKQQDLIIESGSIGEILQKILVSLDGIKEQASVENADLLALLEKADERLQRRDSDVQSYQEDFYRKSITPYIRQFIVLGDMMRKIMNETIDEHLLKDESYWHNQFGKVIESINYILRDFSFTVYQDAKEGENYNPQKQEVISFKETDNVDLDKKISKSLNPGYVWTLPYIIKAKVNGTQLPLKEYELIFRKEQVETYKLI